MSSLNATCCVEVVKGACDASLSTALSFVHCGRDCIVLFITIARFQKVDDHKCKNAKTEHMDENFNIACFYSSFALLTSIISVSDDLLTASLLDAEATYSHIIMSITNVVAIPKRLKGD